jgi:hypothetical protein
VLFPQLATRFLIAGVLGGYTGRLREGRRRDARSWQRDWRVAARVRAPARVHLASCERLDLCRRAVALSPSAIRWRWAKRVGRSLPPARTREGWCCSRARCGSAASGPHGGPRRRIHWLRLRRGLSGNPSSKRGLDQRPSRAFLITDREESVRLTVEEILPSPRRAEAPRTRNHGRQTLSV